tara:strand:+ start:54931 stop:56796 length:1866 start_codon:yes stop_codon:yes gene_type:complete
MINSLLEINSPQSLLVNIILILGIYNLGRLICEKKILKYLKFREFHYGLFGLIFISVPIYFSSLYNFHQIILYKLLSAIILILGLFQLIYIIKKINFSIVLKYSKDFYLLFFVFICLILISFSPATNADSLDYHYGIPIQILNLGFFPNPLNLTWLHGYFGGIIEPTIGLGLLLGSDSFGASHQIFAIFSITGTILGIKKKIEKNEIENILILIFAITPLIFIFSSAKPQLIGVASNLLAFRIIFELKNKDSINDQNIFLVLLLIVFSYLVKFTFIISSSLIFLFLVYKCLNFKKLKNIFIYSLIIVLFLIIPVFLWKIKTLNFSLIETIFYPIPISKPGMNFFLDYLRGHYEFSLLEYGKNNLERIFYLKIFPIFLFIPPSIEKVTTFLGIPLLFLFLFKKNKDKEIYEIRIFILVLYICTSILSSTNTRYYLLLYYLGIFHLYLCGIDFSNIFYKYLRPLLKFHFFVYILILTYGVYSLAPGMINNNLRQKVLNENAIYYNVAKIVNDRIPKNSKVINTFRSTSFFTFNQLRTDWIENLEIARDKKEVRYFMKLILDKKPEYLITSFQHNKIKQLFSLCITPIFVSDDIKVLTRNPFYKDKNFIKLSIYKINHSKCLLN